MNWANRLTLIRFYLAIVFVFIVSYETIYTIFAALVVFFFAAITDIYDGRIARRLNLTSNFGIFMDPLADKILTTAAFVYFVSTDFLRVPAWLVILIISREFLVTGLRLLASKEGVALAADGGGKAKTILQMVAIPFILLFVVIKMYLLKFIYHIDFSGAMPNLVIQNHLKTNLTVFGFWGDVSCFILGSLPSVLMWAILVLTMFSGWSYYRGNRELLKRVAPMDQEGS